MQLKQNYALAPLVWFKTGGPAQYFFKPKSILELQEFLKATPIETPLFYLGAGSNLLIRDGGIDGTVIKLGFHDIECQDETLTIEAGALNRSVVYYCLEKKLSGLEFLIGVPGTIGGAVVMNAGCHNSETKNKLLYATLMLRDGQIVNMSPEELKMTYRHTEIPKNAAVVSATFKLSFDDPSTIDEKINSYIKHRETCQTGGRTCGSTFKNPEGHAAWKLIDESGMRGFRVGDAQVSEKHCNFFVNLGSATSADVENLGEHVRKTVLEKTGVMLEWEIKRVGKL